MCRLLLGFIPTVILHRSCRKRWKNSENLHAVYINFDYYVPLLEMLWEHVAFSPNSFDQQLVMVTFSQFSRSQDD